MICEKCEKECNQEKQRIIKIQQTKKFDKVYKKWSDYLDIEGLDNIPIDFFKTPDLLNLYFESKYSNILKRDQYMKSQKTNQC